MMNVCKASCCKNFSDTSFPHSDASVGVVKGDTADGGSFAEGDTEWKRVQELEVFKDKQPMLFLDSIEPNDVYQGGIGDCWLMAGIACVAEYPGMIQRLFYEKQYNPRGKYHIKIFDQQKGQDGEWVWVTVDDYVPCYRGTNTPKFAKPHENEIWVLLLEKAFAKFCGSYHKLEGGHTIWAIRALTGDFCKYVDPLEGYINVYNIYGKQDQENKRELGLRFADKMTKDMLFATLYEYDKIGALMCCNWKSKTNGLVTSHAYSILEVHDVAGTKLLKIRNPWGKQGEWSGDWGDKSTLWETHGLIRRSIGFGGEKDDGCFFMAFDDFYTYMDTMGICDRSVTVETDCHFRNPYENTCYGPCLGLLAGIFEFWCWKGTCYLCCWRHYSSREVTKYIEKSFCCIRWNERVQTQESRV